MLSQVEGISNPFKFVGAFGVMDEGNGLLYMGARYYDPATGRFISKDPIGWAGGLNLYGYTGNNPVNWVDPEGLASVLEPVINWIAEHGDVGASFNADTGLVGINARIAMTRSGIVGRIGIGWGVGWGISAGPGISFGDSCSGWAITGSASGGSGTVGGSAYGTVDFSGGKKAGFRAGWGLGGGASVTLGYTGTIISW